MSGKFKNLDSECVRKTYEKLLQVLTAFGACVAQKLPKKQAPVKNDVNKLKILENNRATFKHHLANVVSSLPSCKHRAKLGDISIRDAESSMRHS